MWLQRAFSIQVGRVPLWVIGTCGLVGVLVDLDHFIAYYWLTGLNGRFLHTPLLIVSGVVFLGCCAYIARLLLRMVLK